MENLETEKDNVESEKTEKQKNKFLSSRKQQVKNFFKDFKTFINKGNIVNLAVALVIGAAFTKIVNSLVADLVMPLFSMIFGETALSEHQLVVSEKLIIRWGNFLQTIIEFLIIAFCIFLVLRIAVNSQRNLKKLTKREKKALKSGEITPEEVVVETAPIESSEDILRDIRELLRATAGLKEEPDEPIENLEKNTAEY